MAETIVALLILAFVIGALCLLFRSEENAEDSAPTSG
jgi:hypothetical protein